MSESVNPQLALQEVLLAEAAEIVAAREKCLILHKTTDIDAAGDEVEICIRELLRRKLGDNYYVGHGHIVDAEWNTSPQFDVIIIDKSVMPSIFKSQNGTEYFPYEVVYAVGEIKATYDKYKKPISRFVEAKAKLARLAREDVPANYIRAQSGGFYLGEGLTSLDRSGKQNNLFTFIIFADSGNFTVTDASVIYSSIPTYALPSVVCLLNKGLIAYNQLDKFSPSTGNFENISFLVLPERPEMATDRQFAWTLYSNGQNETRALSWGVLYCMLAQHLMNTTVKPESPIRYLQKLASTPSHTFL